MSGRCSPSSATARCESLLKWVNTFEGVHCDTFSDLASGKVLLKCLCMVMPDVMVANGDEPWKELFAIFEEFCGCSLTKAVSAEKVCSGNEEHIARVVVLLLAIAVQSRANEKIVHEITSLDYQVQRDLMFFIETTLAKVKSHAIMTGTFTSGVGEQLPELDTFTSVPTSPRPAHPSTPTPPGGSTDDVFAFPTPHRPALCPSRFYNGLDSEAGAKLLMSPAITGRKLPLKRPLFADSTEPAECADSEREEISRMKHSLRVLEGTLQVEKKLAHEYYSELCAKIEEYEDLKKDFYQLEREKKMGCLQDVKDLRDELEHTSTKLALAEKSLVTCNNKIQSLEVYKVKAKDLEHQVGTLQSEMGSCEEYKMSAKRMEEALLEKSSGLKRLELRLKTTTVELETKTAHIDSLMAENREIQSRFTDARKGTQELESSVKDLEMKMSEIEESELKTMEEKRRMSHEIQQLQGALDASRKQVAELTANQRVCETSVTVSEQEKTELSAELSAKVSELTSKKLEVSSLQDKVASLIAEVTRLHSVKCSIKQLDSEVAGLRTKMTNQDQMTATEVAKLKKELTEKTSMVNSKDLAMSSLKSANEELKGQLSHLRSRVKALEQEKKASSEGFDCQISQLQSIIETLGHEKQTSAGEFESKESKLCEELSSKNSELASKDLRIQSLASTITELENKVVQLETLKQATNNQIQSLKGSKAKFETQITGYRSQVKSQEKDIDQLTAKVTSRDLQLESLQSANNDMQAQVAKLQASYRSMEENLGVKDALVESLKLKAVDHCKAVIAMEAKVRSREAEVQSLETLKRALEAEVSQKDALVESLKSDLKAVTTMETEVHSRKAEIQSLGNSKRALEAEVSQKNALVESLKSELKVEAAKHSKAVTTMETDIHYKEVEIQSLGNSKGALEAEVSEQNALVESLKSELKVEAAEHSKAVTTMETDIHYKEVEIQSLGNSKRALEAELSEKNALVESLKSELKVVTTMETEVRSKEIEVRSLVDSKRTLEAEVSEKNALVESLKSDLKAEAAEHSKAVTTMETEVCSKEAEVQSLRSSKRALEAEASQKDALVESLKSELKVVTTMETEVRSKEIEVQSLVDSKRTLEAEVSEKNALVESLKSDLKAEAAEHSKAVTTMETEVCSKEAEVQSLRSSKRALEAEASQKDALVESLKSELKVVTTMETEIRSKEIEVQSLGNSKRALEAEVSEKNVLVESLKSELKAEAAKHSKALEQAVTTMEAEIRSKRDEIQSLASSKGALEGEVSQMRSVQRTLEGDLTSVVARLAESEEKVSSLVEQRDQLTAAHQKELTAIKARREYEESMLSASYDENSTHRSKVSQLTELVSELQSSLQVANDQAASLALQKSGIEVERSQLQAKLEKEVETSKSREAVIRSYKNKLESSEQHIAKCNSKSQMAREVTRTNQLLQSEQAKLLRQLEVFKEKGEQASLRCEELEKALATEKVDHPTNASQPCSVMEEISTTPWVPLMEVQEGTVPASSSVQDQPSKSLNKHQEEIEVDEKARVMELKRRNTQAPPHLKSSYPIEMQTRPETLTNSNERLKHNSEKRDTQLPSSSSTVSPTSPTLQDGAVATRTRSGGVVKEMLLGRRLSVPSTSPTPAVDYRRKQQSLQVGKATSQHLRGFLDQTGSSGIPGSTAFNVVLSPPKAAPPKRLQERKFVRKVSRDADRDSTRREATTKKQTSSTTLAERRSLRKK